jgi:hypothetical protein
MTTDMRNMTEGGRRRLAVVGGVVAGTALGGGLDALLAHLDGYLMQTISWSNPPGFPGLASVAIIIAGAFFGLGVGPIGAALIGDPSGHVPPTASASGGPMADAQT